MIEEAKGNLLEADAEALVNTVNTVGHMGKGIALQFKQAYPERAGLDALLGEIRRLGIRSIAVPPLGCGNGGLDWRDVEPRIRHALADLPDVRACWKRGRRGNLPIRHESPRVQ